MTLTLGLPSELSYDLPSPSGTINTYIARAVSGVIVNNYTNQRVYLQTIDKYVDAYVVGATFTVPLDITTTTYFQVLFQAEPGFSQPAAIAGEIAKVIFVSGAVIPSAGTTIQPGSPSGENRSPITILFNYFNSLGPHALTTRASYTVPTGRKFFLASAELVTESAGGYAANDVFIETRIDVVTPAGAEAIVKDAYLYRTNVDGARDEQPDPIGLWIPGGTELLIATYDGGSGGWSYHYATAQGQEMSE